MFRFDSWFLEGTSSSTYRLQIKDDPMKNEKCPEVNSSILSYTTTEVGDTITLIFIWVSSMRLRHISIIWELLNP